MRRLTPLSLLLTLLVLPLALVAQQEEKAAGAPEALRREITRLEERIGQANFTCDYKLFARVHAGLLGGTRGTWAESPPRRSGGGRVAGSMPRGGSRHCRLSPRSIGLV